MTLLLIPAVLSASQGSQTKRTWVPFCNPMATSVRFREEHSWAACSYQLALAPCMPTPRGCSPSTSPGLPESEMSKGTNLWSQSNSSLQKSKTSIQFWDVRCPSTLLEYISSKFYSFWWQPWQINAPKQSATSSCLIAWDLQLLLQETFLSEASPVPRSLLHATISQCTALWYTALQRWLLLISIFLGNKRIPQQSGNALSQLWLTSLCKNVTKGKSSELPDDLLRTMYDRNLPAL